MKKGLFDSKEEVFVKKTGKPFKEWNGILNKAKAEKKGHTRIVQFLVKKFKIADTWAEAIAIRFEKEKFLKK
ncbi:MAG: hypothetical protein UX19_C0010G0002 [Candidatus Woesebacteria bacterium GW2011_GWA1_45_8]|uniref:Uncharacterized protein n=1 Tax=Candidatus Woesebacteria bacterium GW2011_GWA1_45_8 TaxID=1618559 RepID=A0A0G1QTP9_9BACT|nr:MAG: hypothetical protein UX19_C0010G0002 [Candidatus Woesebacteria bacterium GW2011_GWA1_45_8]